MTHLITPIRTFDDALKWNIQFIAADEFLHPEKVTAIQNEKPVPTRHYTQMMCKLYSR